MAEYNIKINVKSTSGYDVLYPMTKSDLVTFNNSGSDIRATNTEQAIKEINTKTIETKNEVSNLKTNIIKTRNDIKTNSQSGHLVDALAIKEIENNKMPRISLASDSTYQKIGQVNFGGGDIRNLYITTRYQSVNLEQTTFDIENTMGVKPLFWKANMINKRDIRTYELPSKKGTTIEWASNKTFHYINPQSENWSDYYLQIIIVFYDEPSKKGTLVD